MRNSPGIVFARTLGVFLVGIGLLGGCWPFVERYLLTPAEVRSSALEAIKLSEFLTYWLRASAIHWLVAGIGALLYIQTNGSDRRF